MKGHLSHGSISMMLLLHQLHLQSCPVLPLKGYDLSRPITEWTQCLDIVWSRKKTQSLEPTPKFPNRASPLRSPSCWDALQPHAVCVVPPCRACHSKLLHFRSVPGGLSGGIVFFFPPSPTLASVTLWLILLLLNPSWFILLFPHLVGIHTGWWALIYPSWNSPLLVSQWDTGVPITFRQLWVAGLDHLTACS